MQLIKINLTGAGFIYLLSACLPWFLGSVQQYKLKGRTMKSIAKSLTILVLLLLAASFAVAQDSKYFESDNCTSILVGKKASVDGATMTSHSCDSGTDRTWINRVPRKTHPKGAMAPIFKRSKRTKGPDDPNTENKIGEIPQVPVTYGYINTAYAVMNEHQLAIGETTFGGKRELYSKNGLIDAPELYRLILERAKTAREAIKVADELTKEYGYIDVGECFTFADPNEVWFFEILGPGKDKKGAVWAAVRIPDEEISISANASRIRTLDLKDKDNYMASDNVYSLAEEMGWWDPKSGEEFEFCYAYAHRTSMGCRLREWRVLSLVAPSLKLNPYSENYPLSVKPDKKVSIKDIRNIFRDNYQGTQFEMDRNLFVKNRKGEWIKSPIASPFMNGDLRTLLNLKRERPICVPYATYVQITQSRAWLPNEIGGVVWIGYDNPALTPQIPFYVGINEMPKSYLIEGRYEYSLDCAWWAYRRVAKLAVMRYQEIKEDVRKVWEPMEEGLYAAQEAFEMGAVEVAKTDKKKLRELLTKYCSDAAEKAVKAYIKLGDEIWLKYSGRF